MALQKEVWKNDIIGNLYKDNAFLQKAFNADPFVLQGKVVHLPVAGTPAQVKKNLTSFPQIAVNRADSEITYAIDTYFSLPRQIQDMEKYELSYDKRQSVVGEDEKQLIQSAAEGMLYRWAPSLAANVIPTVGAATSELIDSTATGTRKTFDKSIFRTVAKKMDKANILKAGRTALLTSEHYYQFWDSLSDNEKTNFNSFADPVNGIVGRYMGFDILDRSTVLRYRQTGSVWLPVDEQDAAFVAGAGDSAASLFFQGDCVERALGDTEVFDNPGQALYYGDVFSAYLRLGGRIRRNDGVYAVVEDIAA